MRKLRALLQRLGGLFHRQRRAAEFDAELESNLQMQTEDNVRAGMSPEEARYAALRKFGNVTQVKEDAWNLWSFVWIEQLWRDIRIALRMLWKNRGFSAGIAGLLALGLGITTVMFSLFDAVFLRPLPVRQPQQLVRMVQRLPFVGTRSNFSYRYYEALRDHTTTLSQAFGETAGGHFTLTDPQPAEEIRIAGVTPEYFEVLGVRALYGRVLARSDAGDTPGMAPAVLSYGFWVRRFGADPHVVNGGALLVNGHRYAIVGVMPRDFNGLMADTAPDVRVPLRAWLPLDQYKLDNTFLELAGRLKPGFSRLQAEAECRALWLAAETDYMQRVRKLSPREVSDQLQDGMFLEPLEHGVSVVREHYGDVLKLLMASVGILLLIVCANVGGLLLARSAARQPEFAVRLAVGATRFQLIRQLSAESVLVAAVSALGGLLIVLTVTPLALHLLPPMRDLNTALVPLSLNLNFGWRVFWFMVALSSVTTLLFSLGPAIAASRASLETILKTARSTSHWRGRQILITLQIALCTFLLATASLFVQTFRRLQQTNPGFDRDHIVTFTIDLEARPGDSSTLLKTFTQRVRELPGVISVATSYVGLMRGRGLGTTVEPTGQRITRADFLNTSLNAVSPEYFDTMGIKIVAGRGFVASDTPKPKQQGPFPVLVNKTFAQRFFPNTSPLGKRFGYEKGEEGVAGADCEIIGVVSDAKYRSVREAIVPTFYEFATVPYNQSVLYVRTRMRPAAVIEPVRKILASLDPTVSFREVHTLAEEVDNSMAGERLTAAIASLFGAVAALLAGAGIYGLLAYVVTERRREIGIRMALGAQREQIGELVARQTFVMSAVGITLGIAGALAMGPAIRSLLYGVSPQDPRSLLAAVSLIMITATVATVFPALRATRVDPMVALRYE